MIVLTSFSDSDTIVVISTITKYIQKTVTKFKYYFDTFRHRINTKDYQVIHGTIIMIPTKSQYTHQKNKVT